MKNDYESLLVEVDGSVALVKLNNPASLNSLTAEVKKGLLDFFTDAREDDSIKAIVLTGEGRAFCAGGDINSLNTVGSVIDGQDRMKRLHKLVYAIRDLDKPVIAAVNGFAVGAGMNLALACDIVIAADDAKFSEIFSNIGLVPDAGGLFFLTKLVGPMRAKELCWTARRIGAAEAESMGLVSKVVPLDNLLTESVALAKSLAAGPLVSLRYIKRLINKSLEWDIDSLLEAEAFAQGICLNTNDFREGIAAFKEKRRPVFSGK
jgi:2-(1,2-epoxy-1,2-dihydrophenyl)acetyl-CoA isomerase